MRQRVGKMVEEPVQYEEERPHLLRRGPGAWKVCPEELLCQKPDGMDGLTRDQALEALGEGGTSVNCFLFYISKS